jgi:hypothetical protein
MELYGQVRDAASGIQSIGGDNGLRGAAADTGRTVTAVILRR